MTERTEVVKILEKVNNDSGYTSELISSIKDDSLNKSFIRGLVYGVTENKILIDYIIDINLDKKSKKLPSKIAEIFRISIYQILFLDSIPTYAVVNEAVEMADEFNLSKFKGLLNAVLRKIEGISIEKELRKITDIDTRIKTEFSVGEEFYEILAEQYSKKTTIKILKSFNEKQEFIIRVNNLKSSKKEVQNILNAESINTIDHPFLENALIVENPNGIFKLKTFKKGYFTVQDGGSIIVSDILKPDKNSNVLDFCAAPGSKTCYISELMENTGTVLANDLHENKLVKIKENTKRLGVKNVKTMSFDGTKLNKDLVDKFDYVLLDAPCSGSGIVARKPEIKLNRTSEQVKQLVETQRSLFENAIEYLKIGGVLVYSTCSLFREENEEQLNYFIEKYDNIAKLDIDFKGKKLDYLKFMPYESGTNGFFMSKFQKRY